MDPQLPPNLQQRIITRIIDFICLNARGRLVVVPPSESIPGIDLVVKKRGEYYLDEVEKKEEKIIKVTGLGRKKKREGKEILLSIYPKERKMTGEIFQEMVDTTIFEKIPRVYLVFVIFNPLKQDIEDKLFIIPLEEFKRIAEGTARSGIFKFQSRFSCEEKDRYSQFLLSKDKLSEFFLRTILY